MTKQEPLNLEHLNDTYEIIGELAARDDARTFMAKRRADGLEVVIVVAPSPAGDQGNALSHLAADANLLSSLEHRAFLPIVDGQWVGTDQFAIVTRRTKAPTLHELLNRRDEEFGFPRIAAILREASGVMEWARERKVVHRAVTPETLFVEPGSDRVCVSFAISPLPASGVPGEDADARCIASLARAMFTRSPAAPERETGSLAELRPGLPTRVVEETEAMLQPTRDGAALDVTGYISRIAMAESLKEAEVHLEETRNLIEKQKQAHAEQLEKERREHEQQLTTERKEHERLVSEQAKTFDKERETFERELAKERKALEKEREALAKERAAHSKDCAALAREREAHAKDRAILLEERARHEQLRQEERERLAAEVAALQEQARVHAQMAQQKTAERAQVLAESKRANAESKKAKAEFNKAVVAPVPLVTRTPAVPAGPSAMGVDTPGSLEGWSRLVRWNRKWNVPAAAVALVLLIALAAMAIGRDGNPPARTQVAQHATAAPVIVDSAGGAVARYASIVPLPEVTTDTATLAATASDWTPPPKRRPRPVPVESPPVERAPENSASLFIFENDPARRDSVSTPPARVDTVFRRDTLARPIVPIRRDSVRPDSVPRRDSLSTPSGGR